MNEEIKIEKNVPMPRSYKTGLTEAMKKLKIGDSFLIKSQSVGIKCTTRKQPDGTYRVWRIS